MTTIKDPMLPLKAKLFRGLSDPTRLSILECLRSGEKSVSEIVSATGQSQPNVSGHLACLKDCGLVRVRTEGRSAYYGLSDARMESLMEIAEGILSGVSERVSECSHYECRSARKCVRSRRCVASAHHAPASFRRGAGQLPMNAAQITEGKEP